jgi:SAM-dependent methyltransferase
MDSHLKEIFEKEQKLWVDWHEKDYLGKSKDFVEGLRVCLEDKEFAEKYYQKMCVRKTDNPEEYLFDVDIKAEEMKRWCILEIGCGCGFLGTPFVNRVASYQGVDISPSMIKSANKAWGELGYTSKVKLYAVKEDLLEGLFQDNTFDFIFASNVFIHTPIEITKAYLKQMICKLKPGGFFMFELNMIDAEEGIHKNTTESYTSQEFGALISGLGQSFVNLGCVPEDEGFAGNQLGVRFFGKVVK